MLYDKLYTTFISHSLKIIDHKLWYLSGAGFSVTELLMGLDLWHPFSSTH